LTAVVSLIIGILFIVYGCFFDKWTEQARQAEVEKVPSNVKL